MQKSRYFQRVHILYLANVLFYTHILSVWNSAQPCTVSFVTQIASNELSRRGKTGTSTLSPPSSLSILAPTCQHWKNTCVARNIKHSAKDNSKSLKPYDYDPLLNTNIFLWSAGVWGIVLQTWEWDEAFAVPLVDLGWGNDYGIITLHWWRKEHLAGPRAGFHPTPLCDECRCI
jgi:hypothetical protein